MGQYQLNTLELAHYMQSDPVISKFYGGVLALDQLQYCNSRNKVYIVNLDTSSEPGSHWICIFTLDTPEYFDPAGLPPVDEIFQYLVFLGPKYLTNTSRVQSFVSSSCGVFCLFYCYYRCRGYSFSDIMSVFSDELLVNEVLVTSFYEDTK